MQIWQDEPELIQEENGGCCGLSAVDDARRVAQILDIPYYVMNFKKEFKANVMDYFVDEYLHGRTPVFPLERTTLRPDIMQESSSCQTADMRSAIP